VRPFLKTKNKQTKKPTAKRAGGIVQVVEHCLARGPKFKPQYQYCQKEKEKNCRGSAFQSQVLFQPGLL
jgi:hypothetical protein